MVDILTTLLQTIVLEILIPEELLTLFYIFQVTLVLTYKLLSTRGSLNYANFKPAHEVQRNT
jgi:hypothetical protein